MIFLNRVWTGKSQTQESMFSELVCQTFDDTELGDAMDEDVVHLVIGVNVAATLRELEEAVGEVDGSLSPAELIASAGMQRVRELASRALQELNKE